MTPRKENTNASMIYHAWKHTPYKGMQAAKGHTEAHDKKGGDYSFLYVATIIILCVPRSLKVYIVGLYILSCYTE